MSKKKPTSQKLSCGIIMPISGIMFSGYDYSANYWKSMLDFLESAIRESGYEPKRMWEDASESTITPRIVRNINQCDLAICVISTHNPNVMIELGMRLFADKPVLVIFDENVSKLPFDINDLDSLKMAYRPLYSDYPEIKRSIKDRLENMSRPDFKTYLTRFKQQVPKIDSSSTEEVELAQIVKSLSVSVDVLNRDVADIKSRIRSPAQQPVTWESPDVIPLSGPTLMSDSSSF